MTDNAVSIYRPPRAPRSDMYSYAHVKGDSDRGSSEGSCSAPVHLRRAQPSEILLARTVMWMDRLPISVQPRALSKQYARIANLLCVLWDDDAACRQYFMDLLTDRRGGRKGFPEDVLRDLHALQEYYCRGVAPATDDEENRYEIRSVWDGPDRGDRGCNHLELMIALLVVTLFAAIAPV